MSDDILTDEEKGIIGIVRFNKLFHIIKKIDIKFHLGIFRFHIEMRSRKNLWGRFGGGWNWELGLQISRKTIIINWLIGSIRIDW